MFTYWNALQTGQPDVSKLLRGHFTGTLFERLFGFLTALGREDRGLSRQIEEARPPGIGVVLRFDGYEAAMVYQCGDQAPVEGGDYAIGGGSPRHPTMLTLQGFRKREH